MNKVILGLFTVLLSASCVSKKKYADLQNRYSDQEGQLSQAKMELAACLESKKNAQSEVKYLRSTNFQLMKNVGNMATLTKKEAENLSRSLERIQEKDLTIRKLEDALNKRDSVTFALVSQLKGATVGLNDEDISISVEKGVVYVSISDKLLFASGSYALEADARQVLAKVAQVIQAQPELEFMVEGHTDNKSVKSTAPYADNWELSVQRATAVVRALQNDFGISPKRMTAAGKGEYQPVASNDSAEGRAKNRRTRIVILPKLDEFYALIEKGMQ